MNGKAKGDKALGQNPELTDVLQRIIKGQDELQERLDELEKGKTKDGASEALLQMVNFLYDTDDKHISELTRIPIQAARPLAYAMGLDSILDRKSQKDGMSLSQRIRLNYFRLMRSAGGVHLGRGMRLAEEQAAAVAEQNEEIDIGGE